MADVKSLFKDLGFILKFVDMILLIVACVMLADAETAYYDMRTRDVVAVAVAGFLLIILAFLIVYIFDETHKFFELIFLLSGSILNLVSGILNLVSYIDSNTGHEGRGGHGGANTLILSIMCITVGVLMLIDFIFQIKK